MATAITDYRKSYPVKLNFYEEYMHKLFNKADIQINGSRPWDIQVHDSSLYANLFKKGSLAFGESYMDGLWDCEKLDELTFRIIRANLDREVSRDFRAILYFLKSKFLNQQSVNKVQEVAKKHYDVGNDLFAAMLDKRMMYSCAYWDNAETLDQAQENKLELICQKLKLLPGQRVLDIGCGWGGFAQYAAEKYKVDVVGITISKQQLQLAKERCANLPVEIRLQDYRSLNEKFDRVVSIGMFEHVGYKNYVDYMQTVRNALKDDGLFLLHTIGGNVSLTTIDPWINTYIFPNAMMPSVAQIGKSIENKFILEDWHSLGSNYDLTLMAWMDRFKHAWSQIREKYDERFYRMWIYYLSTCAASFRAKRNNLWQIVLSPPTNLNAYVSVR